MAELLDNPDSGTEQATPDQDDTAPEWDYYDPDEDTVENPDEEATDERETDEDEDPEQDEATDDEGDDEETSEDEQSPEETFELANGETVTRDELLSGYLRQSDYSRKTAEVAQSRKTVQAEAQRIHDITEGFIDFITANIPDEPSIALAQTDPAAYTAQKAAYDATLAQVQKLVQQGTNAKQAVGSMTDDQRRQTAAQENAKLAHFVPETATAKGREAFFEAVSEAAQSYGFTADEMNSTLDSRIFRMAHDAAQWRRSQAKRTKAKAKVQKAPQAAPQRPAKGRKASGNKDAMARLNRSGSIRDAMAVDFE